MLESKETIPPNAVPFQTLPVTSWKGLVDISCPAPATPMITDVPHPLWQDSNAARFKKAYIFYFSIAYSCLLLSAKNIPELEFRQD